MAKTTTHADYTATALTLTTAAQPNITSLGTLTSLIVDNITIDGSVITVGSANDLTIDAVGDIIFDADGGDVKFKDAGTHWASVYTNGTNTYIQNMVNSGDVYLSGKDGSGNGVNALILDMSGSGAATFNAGGSFGGAVQLNDAQLNIHSSSASAIIGSIGNTANDLNIFSTTTGHNGLRFHVNGILPTDNSGTIVDNDADLGDPSYRFKDLYLGGGITAGGNITVTSATATTNGMVRLQNNMDNNYETLRIESLGDYDAHIGFFADGSSNYYWGAGVDYSDSGKFKIANDNLLATNTKFTIHTSGCVGIGSTTDRAIATNVGTLVVNGSAGGGIWLSDDDQSSTRSVIYAGNNGSVGELTINNGTGVGSGGIMIQTNETERMRISSAGRVMIGRTSLLQSDNMLTIEGNGSGAGNAMMDIRNTSTSDTCGCIALSKGSTTTSSANRFIWFFTNNFGTNMGAIGGNGVNNVQFVSSSDERLKENIQPITGSLDKVLALNPVSFDWKESGEHREAGFVAQEVEKVLPEYVNTEDDEMKTKSITGGMTAGYIAVLTKAIQEQQEQIDALKAKLEIE